MKISYSDFVDGYRKGEYDVYLDKKNINVLINTDKVDDQPRILHSVSVWAAISLIFIIPAVLIYVWNVYAALVAFSVGVFIAFKLRESSYQHVIDLMLSDEDYCEHVLQSSGAVIRDKEGDEIEVKFKSSTTVSELITEYVIQIATELENVLEYHGINATVTEMYTGDPKYIFYVHFNKNINIRTLRKIIKNISQLKDNLEITRKHQYPNTNYIAILIPALPQSYFTKKIKEL